MKNLFNSILDLIYRKKCYFCGKSKESVKMCQNCFEDLSYNDYQTNRIINGVNVYSSGVYDKNLQKLIRGLKYHKQKELAFFLAKFMAEYFKNLNINKKFQVIPVPLHANRIKKRKYNHMELVAEEFCKITGNLYNSNLIYRIKDTKPQYKLNKKERMENLANAFIIDNSSDLKLPLLLLDDICTTGSTFEEMITTFKNNHFNDITCLSASNP